MKKQSQRLRWWVKVPASVISERYAGSALPKTDSQAPSHGYSYTRFASIEACDSASASRSSKPNYNIGTNLQSILSEYGASSCQRCNRTAKKMDMMTTQEVEENFEALVQEIYSNIHKLSFWEKAKAAATALRHGLTIESLLIRAIEKSKV